jgi:hypothetical protein
MVWPGSAAFILARSFFGLLLLLANCDTVLCMFEGTEAFTDSHKSLATSLATSYGGANQAAAQPATILSTRQQPA